MFNILLFKVSVEPRAFCGVQYVQECICTTDPAERAHDAPLVGLGERYPLPLRSFDPVYNPT